DHQDLACRHDHSGDAAPFSTHSRNFLTNSSCESGGFVRPSPGSHPHCTSLSFVTCSTSCSSVLPPFRLGSFNWSANSRRLLPSHTSGVPFFGRCQLGLPGGMFAPGRFVSWWQFAHFRAYFPLPSWPRLTFWTC